MQRKVIVIIACLAILVSIWSIWMRIKASSSGNYQPLLSGIGIGLAEETVKAVRDQGQVVVVVEKAQVPTGEPIDLRLRTFQAELKKHSSIRLIATEIVPALRIEDRMTPSCPSATFAEIMQRHATVAAIVFFMPVPEWNGASSAIPQSGSPKLIALDHATLQVKARYGGYFTSSVLSALIIPRRDSSSVLPSEPKTPRELFDRDFQVVTPQNYESLPE